jgi:hypothetical protein
MTERPRTVLTFDPDTGAICIPFSKAMTMLGVGRTKLYEMIAGGQVEALKLGRSTMILRSSIVDLINRAERL